MKHRSVYTSLFLALNPLLVQACGESSPLELKEAWNGANAPSLFDTKTADHVSDYVYDWKQLPLTGELKNRPWSDDYWPTYRGGISYRWNDRAEKTDQDRYAYELKPASSLEFKDMLTLSPAEKLDLFLGDDSYSITNAERERTQIMSTVPGSPSYDKDFSIPTWEGLCHAWAPASFLFKEPRSVTLTNDQGRQVPFGASDVKALLSYFMDEAGTPGPFLGQRCNDKFSDAMTQMWEGKITEAEFLTIKESSSCRDTNAGAFHLVLSNQLARLDKGFIADVTRDAEVWNQPVYRFSSQVVSESQEATLGAAVGTVREITLATTMYYGGEALPHWDVSEGTFIEGSKTYSYRVELNAKDEVIGGAWLEDERPDFLWIVDKYDHVDSPIDNAIRKIYAASISASP